MAEPFIGEIRIFPCTFPPEFWAWCSGQILPIGQNPALYAIIGTLYGGNGNTTMGLPDLTRRAAMGQGTGPGLHRRNLGDVVGTNTVELTELTTPEHDHTGYVSTDFLPPKLQSTPSDKSYPSAMRFPGGTIEGFADPDQNLMSMAENALDPAGQSQPHENRQPFLVMNFCIALEGLFPSRN